MTTGVSATLICVKNDGCVWLSPPIGNGQCVKNQVVTHTRRNRPVNNIAGKPAAFISGSDRSRPQLTSTLQQVQVHIEVARMTTEFHPGLFDLIRQTLIFLRSGVEGVL